MATSTDESLGLATLAGLDTVLIGQKMTMMKNKYAVLAPDGSQLFYAKEESSGLAQVIAGNKRSFQIDIFDMQDKLVAKLRRPFTIGSDKMEVSVTGQPAFVVRKEITLLKPVLRINDAADRPVYKVKGPAITSGEADFVVQDPNKSRVAVIRKKWGGARELVTNANSFEITFPPSMTLQHKIGFIATGFLIDFLFYEK